MAPYALGASAGTVEQDIAVAEAALTAISNTTGHQLQAREARPILPEMQGAWPEKLD